MGVGLWGQHEGRQERDKGDGKGRGSMQSGVTAGGHWRTQCRFQSQNRVRDMGWVGVGPFPVGCLGSESIICGPYGIQDKGCRQPMRRIHVCPTVYQDQTTWFQGHFMSRSQTLSISELKEQCPRQEIEDEWPLATPSSHLFSRRRKCV